MPVEDTTPFNDEHYATFYGAGFNTSPFVWKGGLKFTHAVASGDPFDTSVLLWTRAVPVESDDQLPDQSVPACVSFVIHTTPTLSGKPVDSGEAFTSYDVDWTLKVEAQGLEADTKYFFQFADCTNPKSVSPIGSTRTIPSPNTPASEVNGGNPLTLAVFSCSFWQNGWFNAYGVAAHNTSADIFVHLGDYIYEPIDGAPGIAIGRPVLGRELATIHDYRQRLAQYRTVNLDAWDGYRANRARLVDHLYNQEISNTVILAGDSHANWVSDLSHANDTNYDPITGHGAIGVEFAGTAVTSHSRFSDGPVPGPADGSSRQLVQINPELQWSEQFYRGFFMLTIDEETTNATFFAMRNIGFANLDHFQSAHFVVKAGESGLSRPIAGGNVTAGALKSGGGQ